MAVVAQPCNTNCNLPQPGKIDDELNEFWVGDPWMIFRKHNLSAFERNRMFLNASDRRFLDISFVSGTDNDGDARASLAADLNHDGMLELIVRSAGGAPLLIYENEFSSRNYLKISLRGTKSNRLGIGGRVTVTIDGQPIVRECFPVNTYLSQAPTVLHFGAGNAEKVDRIVIAWPSGRKQELLSLPVNRHVVVTEGSSEVEVIEPGQTFAP